MFFDSVADWKVFVATHKGKKATDIAHALAVAKTGEVPAHLKVMSWLCGSLCCVPCILSHAIKQDINDNYQIIMRKIISMEYKDMEVGVLLNLVIPILEKYPSLLFKIHGMNTLFMDNKNMFDFLDLIPLSHTEKLVVIAISPVLNPFTYITDGYQNKYIPQCRDALTFLRTP